jgi:hypothetical protein
MENLDRTEFAATEWLLTGPAGCDLEDYTDTQRCVYAGRAESYVTLAIRCLQKRVPSQLLR